MKNNNPTRILIVAPHQDDEIIGCGGLICYFREKHYGVKVVHVFSGTSGVPAVDGPQLSSKIRQAEARKASKIGGYTILPSLNYTDRDRSNDNNLQSDLINLFRSVQPNVLLLPHKGETDYEHNLVSVVGREASWLSAVNIFPELGEPLSVQMKVMYYEVWKNIENPSLFLRIDKYVDKKKTMLNAFESQMKSSDWLEGSLGTNAYRGVTITGRGHLEVFGSEPIDIQELRL